PCGSPGRDDPGHHPEDRAEADRERRGLCGEVEEDGAARSAGLVDQEDDRSAQAEPDQAAQQPDDPGPATSSRTMRRPEPPMARRMPISRVRSATLMAIVLITDRPPTMRLMAATPMMIALKITVVAPTVLENSAPVMVALFSTAASIAAATVVG